MIECCTSHMSRIYWEETQLAQDSFNANNEDDEKSNSANHEQNDKNKEENAECHDVRSSTQFKT